MVIFRGLKFLDMEELQDCINIVKDNYGEQRVYTNEFYEYLKLAQIDMIESRFEEEYQNTLNQMNNRER